MYIHERMSKNVATVTPDCTVSKALQVVFERRYRRLPVIDGEGRLEGLITEKLLTQVNSSKAASLSLFEINYLLRKTKVRDIMITNVFTVLEDNLIEEGALIMKEHDIDALPVVNKDNLLVGIITQKDIFSSFIKLMNIREPGARIIVDPSDRGTGLSEITGLVENLGFNIKHVTSYQKEEYKEIIIKIDSGDTGDLPEQLKNRGYNVLRIQRQL